MTDEEVENFLIEAGGVERLRHGSRLLWGLLAEEGCGDEPSKQVGKLALVRGKLLS